MSDRDEGGPAFPCGQELDGCGMPRTAAWYGMTLRDYFAAHASEEDIAEFMPSTVGEAAKFECEHGFGPTRQWARYQHADAMLAVRAAAELGRGK